LDAKIDILKRIHARPVQFAMGEFSLRQLMSMRTVVASHNSLLMNIKISSVLEITRRGYIIDGAGLSKNPAGFPYFLIEKEKELPVESFVEVFQIKR